MTLWAVHVREASPPADAKPVEWFLLTTCKLDDVEDALACVRWYCLRWRIMHMTLLVRTCPTLPADVLFSDVEIEVLEAYAKKNE